MKITYADNGGVWDRLSIEMPTLSGVEPQETEFAAQLFPWLTPNVGNLELEAVSKALASIVQAKLTNQRQPTIEVDLLREIQVGRGRENTVLEFFKVLSKSPLPFTIFLP